MGGDISRRWLTMMARCRRKRDGEKDLSNPGRHSYRPRTGPAARMMNLPYVSTVLVLHKIALLNNINPVKSLMGVSNKLLPLHKFDI